MTIAAAFLEACLEELAAPKPGNVHIHAPGHRMTVEDFARSAAVSAPLLCRPGAPLGRRILDAATATREAVGQNTNLGILLLCAPLAMAVERSISAMAGAAVPPAPAASASAAFASGRTVPDAIAPNPTVPDAAVPTLAVPMHPVSWPGLARPSKALAQQPPQFVDGRAKPGHDTGGLRAIIRAIIVASDLADADAVFAAIRLANPAGLGSAERHDVRRPAAVTLPEAMAEAAGRDSIARQWSNGFADILGLGVATYVSARADGPGASLAVYLAFLSAFPDSHVARKHGTAVAAELQREAARVAADIAGLADPLPKLLAWDTQLKSAGINPGTSADLTVATAFAWRLGCRPGLRSTVVDG